MSIYYLSLGLNAVLFVLGLIYYMLKYQQNKENVQETSEEYKSLKILNLIILLICLIPIPFLIYGPGNPNDVHKINESISLEQVYKATEYLNEALLKTYFK